MSVDITNLKGADLWSALTSGEKVEVQKQPRKRKKKAKSLRDIEAPTEAELKQQRLNRWTRPDTTKIHNGTWIAIEVNMMCVDFTCASCNTRQFFPAYPQGSNIMLKLQNKHIKDLIRYVPAGEFGAETTSLPAKRIIRKTTTGLCPSCFIPSEPDEVNNQ